MLRKQIHFFNLYYLIIINEVNLLLNTRSQVYGTNICGRNYVYKYKHKYIKKAVLDNDFCLVIGNNYLNPFLWFWFLNVKLVCVKMFSFAVVPIAKIGILQKFFTEFCYNSMMELLFFLLPKCIF